MALNIPMPGQPGDALLKGIDTGSQMFARLMQPIIQREQLAEQGQYHKGQLTHQQRALEEQMRQHQQNYALKQMVEQRMASMAPLQRQAEMLRIENLKNKLDPNYEFNQFKNIADKFSGGESGFNADVLKNNPMLRGFFKHKFGYDPLAPAPQTPEEKHEDAISLFREKEGIKNENKGGESPTNAVLTQNQQALQGIDTVLPMLDELINDPAKVYGRFDFNPSKKAAYNAKTSGMIDTLVAAQSLPKVQASIDLVEQQIRRATNEGDSEYIARLKDLRKDLVNRRSKAQSVVKNRKVNSASSNDFSQMSEEELRAIAGGG